MSKQLLSLGVAVLIWTFGGVASSQTFSYGTNYQTQPGGTGFGDGGFYRPFGGYYSSTYEEGVLRGWGDLNRSLGERNYFNSLAAINLEDARAKALVNAEKQTETYFRLKQINAAARQAERPSRLTTEQYVLLAKRQAPDRLSEAEYNRALGRLSWPAVLADKEYAAERDVLDAAFAGRGPTDVGINSQFHGLVRQMSGSLQAKLQARLATMSPAEYIAAKKFLAGLAYESQQPLALAAVAAR